MKMLKRLFCTLALMTLAACGGGGGSAGTAPFGNDTNTPTTPTSTASASDMVLTLSASSVANTGAETVVATATTIDGNRNTIAGVPVTISVDSNAVATTSGTVTNASGQVSATVGIGSDKTNRTITVTAKSGNLTKTALLQVQDTGGGNSGTASDFLLTLSSATISNSGTTPVTATVTALDAKRNVLTGVVVSLSADAGATIAPSGTTTNAQGVVSAQIGIGGDPTLRTIKVTATVAGLAPKTVNLSVVAAPAGANPTAADLSLALSANAIPNGGSSVVTATITAVDANRNALAGIPVTVSVDSNAVASVSGTTTNAQGTVTANIGIGSDRSNRSITVTASSGSLTRTATFNVVGATLTASFSPTVIVSTTANKIEYRLVDFNGTAMAGQRINITRAGQPTTTGSTDVNGKYTYSYDAPAAAATLTVTADAAGETKSQSISVVSAGTSVPDATTTPQSASLTPTPSVVSVNAVGSTTNQVELRALFLGANNQPVPNVRVVFKLDPANSSDGSVSAPSGSQYYYADSTGVARGTFTPGQRSSPTDGVRVMACWAVRDFDTTRPCPSTGSGSQPDINMVAATLTIASEALSVNIRTNNAIKVGPAGLTYIKEFVAMVVDAAGQAKADVLITPSVDLAAYYKGYYQWNGKLWVQFVNLAPTENYSWNPSLQQWVQGPTTTQPQCPNEDSNRNGVREAGAWSATAPPPALSGRQEDLNWNGDIDPRKSDVAIKMVGSPRTDANGLAVLQIEYGKNLASWVDFVITVTASGIAGTEARARYSGLLYGVGNLPYPANDVTAETVPPAFVISPYGRGGFTLGTGVCTDTN